MDIFSFRFFSSISHTPLMSYHQQLCFVLLSLYVAGKRICSRTQIPFSMPSREEKSVTKVNKNESTRQLLLEKLRANKASHILPNFVFIIDREVGRLKNRMTRAVRWCIDVFLNA
jgi:hypothetical protein